MKKPLLPHSSECPPRSVQTRSHQPSPVSQSSKAHPQAYDTLAPARTVLVNCDNWKCTRFAITDSEAQTPLFNVKLGLLKPQMTFASALTAEKIATVDMHALHSRIDTTVRDRPITLTSHVLSKGVYTYTSSALQGATLTWKSSKKLGFNLECVDEEGVVMARFHFISLSFKHVGRLELVGERGIGDEFFEEIMVTGLALAYYLQWLVIALAH